MSDVRKRRLTAGAILIAVGLAFFLIPRFDVFEIEYLLLGLGLVFLVSYFASRRYGLLVPGGVLTGLGVGELADDAVRSFGDGGQLGLGLGFVSIYVIAYLFERRTHWWPLIPGAFLILSGLEMTEEAAEYVFNNWPLMLVLIGVVLLIAGLRSGKRSNS